MFLFYLNKCKDSDIGKENLNLLDLFVKAKGF